MVRLVIDTDVMVAALESDTGASRALLVGVLSGEAPLLLSTPLLLVYEAVQRDGKLWSAADCPSAM